jgi:hypothetical protein
MIKMLNRLRPVHEIQDTVQMNMSNVISNSKGCGVHSKLDILLFYVCCAAMYYAYNRIKPLVFIECFSSPQKTWKNQANSYQIWGLIHVGLPLEPKLINLSGFHSPLALV